MLLNRPEGVRIQDGLGHRSSFAAAGGAGISFVGQTAEAVAASTTTDIELPSGLAQNDIVYIGWSRDTGTPGTNLIINSADWIQIYVPAAQGSPSAQVIRKVMGPSPDSVCNIENTAGAPVAFVVCAFRGMDTTTPEDGVAVVLATGTSGLPDGGSITPATTGAWALVFGGLDDDNATDIVAPTDYSNLSAIAAGGVAGTTSSP